MSVVQKTVAWPYDEEAKDVVVVMKFYALILTLYEFAAAIFGFSEQSYDRALVINYSTELSLDFVT